MAESPIYVFSHDPAASKPVATLTRPFDGVNSAAFQLIIGADASSNNYWTIGSKAAGNPLYVVPTANPPTGRRSCRPGRS